MRLCSAVVFVGLRSLYGAVRALVHEIAKFGLIGAVAFAMTLAISNWLHFGPLKVGPLTSLGVAMLVAATFSYFANRHWTWRHRERTGFRREYSLFILLSAVGLAVTEIPVFISEYVLQLHSPLAYNISANVVGTALGTLWRFWAFKRWVFLEPEPARSDDAAHVAMI
jgi:putative flippase GtrA